MVLNLKKNVEEGLKFEKKYDNFLTLHSNIVKKKLLQSRDIVDQSFSVKPDIKYLLLPLFYF